MLDTYIIDRIRRDREYQRRDTRIPLHIDDRQPARERPDSSPREPRRDERGSVVIDYRL